MGRDMDMMEREGGNCSLLLLNSLLGEMRDLGEEREG